jgi:hypothetical protein
MKQIQFSIRLFCSILLGLSLMSLYGCKDDDTPPPGEELPKSEKTVDDINTNVRALQKLLAAKENDIVIRSCEMLSASVCKVELPDGNSFSVLTEITAFGKNEGVAYSPAVGIRKEADTYYWTLDGEWILMNNAKWPVTTEQTKIPVVGIDKDGYWTIKCNGEVQVTGKKIEEGKVKSVFKQIELSDEKQVTFTFNVGTLSIVLLREGKGGSVIPPVMGDIRRPISPNQPAWLIHIDTWNTADAQKIIDLIPSDIRPYVIFNIALSISHDDTSGAWNKVEYGYETAKSWLRTCAENNVWAMIQPASGGFCHFPDYATYEQMEGSLFEEFYKDYPNFLGFNYCEQFWGFDDPFSVTYPQRLRHWANLMKLNVKYGGYLVVSFCGPGWSAGNSPLAMMKRDTDLAAICKQYPESLIVCEKFTSTYGFFDIESACLGLYLSGYAGQYGIRFDQCGWNAIAWNGDSDFPVAAGAIPIIEHTMFTGQTVFDGPELIWMQDFKEVSESSAGDGFYRRNWECFPQFVNINMDIYRKIIDGTIRIMSRQEVIDRTKFIIVNDITPNGSTFDPGYCAPANLYEGLYRLDVDGNQFDHKIYFKKTGRYPTIPMTIDLVDEVANSFAYKINASQFSGAYGDIKTKQSKFNRIFPEEYTGDMYVGRHENAWVAYNPYADIKTASIPFKYNTCEKMELACSKYSVSVIKEYADRVTFYLTNYGTDGKKKSDVIKIIGNSSKPTYTYQDRATSASCDIKEDWKDDVYTLTVNYNGAVDITVRCSGNATGRETQYTQASVTAPASPQTYLGPRQYEAECFDYKNVGARYTNAVNDGIRNYTALGYINFGTRGDAAVRDEISVTDAGSYMLKIKYRAPSAAVNSIDLYVNDIKVATPEFTQITDSSDAWQTTSVSVSLKAGKNQMEFRANGTNANGDVYLDNIVVENRN